MKYYKMNITFLALFFGATAYNFVANSQVFFGKEWFGKAYLGMVAWSLFGLWVFSHRHIKNLWLLKGGKEIAIETYTNFGLTYNRPKVLPVACFEGNRVFVTQSLNLFQLEYAYKSSWAKITKRRSFFYRPEEITDNALWRSVRTGCEIDVPDVESDQVKQESDLRKRMQKKRDRIDYR